MHKTAIDYHLGQYSDNVGYCADHGVLLRQENRTQNFRGGDNDRHRQYQLKEGADGQQAITAGISKKYSCYVI